MQSVLVLLAQILFPFGQTWVFHKFGWVFHKFTENGEFYNRWFLLVRDKNRDACTDITVTALAHHSLPFYPLFLWDITFILGQPEWCECMGNLILEGIGQLIWVRFPSTGKMVKMCVFLSSTVTKRFNFSTGLKRFCPLDSKNVFVLVLAHLDPS